MGLFHEKPVRGPLAESADFILFYFFFFTNNSVISGIFKETTSLRLGAVFKVFYCNFY